jgi:N utilization substance protein A
MFVAGALSPAKVSRVEIDEETKTALVIVPDNQLSLAIGREGQNARLAAKLTGWRIDIKSETQIKEIEAKKIFADLPEEVAAPAATEAVSPEPPAANAEGMEAQAAQAAEPAAGEPAVDVAEQAAGSSEPGAQDGEGASPAGGDERAKAALVESESDG